jgi:hypothetical protein
LLATALHSGGLFLAATLPEAGGYFSSYARSLKLQKSYVIRGSKLKLVSQNALHLQTHGIKTHAISIHLSLTNAFAPEAPRCSYVGLSPYLWHFNLCSAGRGSLNEGSAARGGLQGACHSAARQ